MKNSILIVLVLLGLFACQQDENKTEATSQAIENEVLKFADIIGDTLRYDLGEPVFDIVITSDTTLYWKSLNPKYGTEAHEKITVLPISEHENMVAYIEKSSPAVCWFNDFEREISTVSVFVGSSGLMTFLGTVKRKHKK